MLIYPILNLALACVWLSNLVRLNTARQYIKNEIETYIGESHLNWEHSITKPSGAFNIIFFFGNRGIFLGTEIVALVTALFVAKPTFTSWSAENLLLALAILSIVMTLVIVFLPTNKH